MDSVLWIAVFVGIVNCVLIIVLLMKRSGGESRMTEMEIAGLRSEVQYMTNIVMEMQNAQTEMQDRRFENMQAQLGEMNQNVEQRLENVRNTLDRRVAGMQEENSRRLEQMQHTVDEKLQKTLETRIAKSFEIVSEQLQEVYRGLGEMKKLAGNVDDLSKILTKVKTRGILGELQLGAILEQILSGEQYAENVETRPGSGKRVEFAVKLPGSDGHSIWLPIDSKFPGDAYRNLQEAYERGDKSEISAYAKSLETAFLKAAKDIREKYIEPPYTTDFGIMFLPVEGLYAEAVRLGMVEKMQREYHINIAGPTTMAALLNSLQMGFKTLAIQKHSTEVWKVLSQVKSEFAKFEEVLTMTQRRIDQANSELDKLVGVRTRSINKSLQKVSETIEIGSEEMED